MVAGAWRFGRPAKGAICLTSNNPSRTGESKCRPPGWQTPVPLDELESHLREETQDFMRSGLSEEAAFETARRKIGRPEVLKTEFAKVTGTIYEQLKQIVCAVAGIPNYQLATNMNLPNQNLEPRWATYFKSAALIFRPFLSGWVRWCLWSRSSRRFAWFPARNSRNWFGRRWLCRISAKTI